MNVGDLAADMATFAGTTIDHARRALDAALNDNDPGPLRGYGIDVGPICDVVATVSAHVGRAA